METSLAELAQLIEGTVIGDAQMTIRSAGPFESAEADEITFAGSAKYLKNLSATQAGAVIVPLEFETAERTIVQVKNPPAAFARILHYFFPPTAPLQGISPSAVIGKRFRCGSTVSVGPCAVIGDDVTLGEGVVIHAGTVIGNRVVIGDDATLHPNTTVLERCIIGNRVIVHAGTVIGSDGFGFAPDGQLYHKIPHVGIVQIDDDVEIGAANTIDRATFGKTWIQRGVKTDNLVHIAHNVTVGEDTVLVAQVGVSGSVQIGKHVILAGQAGIAGHLSIGDGAIVGPKTGIGQSVPAGEIYSGGVPPLPHRQWLRFQRVLPSLPDLKKRLERLERQIAVLESASGPEAQSGS